MTTTHHDSQHSPSLRITCRAEAGHFRREMDISLPADSSLDEIMGEVTDLMNAPTISKPWRATTAAGKAIDHVIPLAQTQVADGSIILLRPLANTSAPVIRDAAEALTLEQQQLQALPFVSAWTLLGLGLTCGLGGSLSTWALGAAVASVAAFVLHLWDRDLSLLAPACVIFAGGAGAVFVGEFPLSLVAGSSTAAFALAVLKGAKLGNPRLTGSTITVALLGYVAWAGSFMRGLWPGDGEPQVDPHQVASATMTIVAGILIMSLAPGITTRVAGLRVPLLPTTGEELEVADIPRATLEGQARRAQRLYEGVIVGAAVALIPSLALIARATTAPNYGLALSVVLVIGVLLHASRHVQPWAVWSLMGIGASASVTACVIAATTHGWPQLSIAGMVVAAMLSSGVWVRRINHVEPTTLVWIERAEVLCVTAIIPLCLHLGGVFAWIRGIG